MIDNGIKAVYNIMYIIDFRFLFFKLWKNKIYKQKS